jgi:hypothetical protein
MLAAGRYPENQVTSSATPTIKRLLGNGRLLLPARRKRKFTSRLVMSIEESSRGRAAQR